MALNLDSLQLALRSLKRALEYASPRLSDEAVRAEESEILRAGIVQNFEFCYELCWKYIKRWLDINISPGAMDGVSRKELFRTALEQHLIDDFDAWTKYHMLRNLTSHTYNQSIAIEITSATAQFWQDAMALYQAIAERND